MSAVRFPITILALLSLLVVDRATPSGEAASSDVKEAPNKKLTAQDAKRALNKMPVRFEANKGQFSANTQFKAHRGATTMYIGSDATTLAVGTRKSRTAVRMRVDGGRSVTPVTSGELVTKTNYLRGQDPKAWQKDVPSFAKVTYPGVLDGVDLVYHGGEGGSLEYDFVVAPGKNPGSIAMKIEGGQGVKLTENGDLAIATRLGDIIQAKPRVYQHDASGKETTIEAGYRLVGDKVAFEVAAYDQGKELVIDPVVGFSTYLGGEFEDELFGVATDSNGNSYVTGGTWSDDFPLQGALDSVNQDSCNDGCSPSEDVFVSKLDATGSNLVYSTYIGGEFARERGTAIAVRNNEAFVVGWTQSDDFPLAPLSAGPEPFPQSPNTFYAGNTDGFALRLNAAGNGLLYSTYLSGTGADDARGIALDGSGNAYITGTTQSFDFTNPQLGFAGPTPNGAGGALFSGTPFIVKLNVTGTTFTSVTELGNETGASGGAIALDSGNRPIIVGVSFDSALGGGNCTGANSQSGQAYAAAYNQTEDVWDYVTCFGGNNYDEAFGVAIDKSDNAIVVGMTDSGLVPNGIPQPPGNGFPATVFKTTIQGNSDAFVMQVHKNGSLGWGALLGGELDETAYAVAIDATNAIWVTGSTSSTQFPTKGAPQPNLAPGGGGKLRTAGFIPVGGEDAFVTRFAQNAGSTDIILGFSTYFGGTNGLDVGNAIAASGTGVTVGGTTGSVTFPVTTAPPFPANAFQTTNKGQDDGFVARLSIPPLLISPPSITLGVGQTQQFLATGGVGNYTFSLTTDGSGANVSPSGAYAAGVTGNTTDIVTVTDEAGQTDNAVVTVGAAGAELVLSPATSQLAPSGQEDFTAAGGTPPYTFGFVSSASGGFINATSGHYQAGPNGGRQDIVRVIDNAGNIKTATVTITAGLTITPASPSTPPLGTIEFIATGGSGGNYIWSITKNGSQGTINSGTGEYVAGPDTKTVDTVQVKDGLGNLATVNVSVGGGLAISPAQPRTTPKGSIAFSAIGGSNSYTWSVNALSGGTIDPATGAYQAGTTGDVIDIVKATDSLGSEAEVQVTVGPSLTLTPTTGNAVSGGKIAFTAAGGSGAGYVFNVDPNLSGGTITPDGQYVAGPKAAIDGIKLVDSLGNQALGQVTVTAAPTGVGGSSSGGPNTNGINIGGGGNDDCSCRTVGTQTSNDGLRILAGAALALGLVIRRRRSSK